jgi:hypothetical protein
MSKIGTLRDYLKELGRLRPQLERFHGVWDVDIGFRYSGGEPTDDLAARLFIIGPKRPAPDRTTLRLAPRSVGGLPIDIVSFQFDPHAGKLPSAKRLNTKQGILGGLSIGTGDDAPGTLGAVFRSSKYEGLLGLTSSHLAPDEKEHVFAPSPVDQPGGVDLGEVIAIDYEYGASLIRLSASAAPAVVGAVIGLPSICGIVREDELHELAAGRRWVTKSGRTTGVTRARITGLSSSATITIIGKEGYS